LITHEQTYLLEPVAIQKNQDIFPTLLKMSQLWPEEVDWYNRLAACLYRLF